MARAMAAKALVPEIGPINAARYAARLARSAKRAGIDRAISVEEQTAIINQPVDHVAAFIRTSGPTGSYRTVAAEMPPEDPAFWRTYTVLGRDVEVRYSLYAIPGGTQVSAVSAESSYGSSDLRSVLALKTARQQIELDLHRLADVLE